MVEKYDAPLLVQIGLGSRGRHFDCGHYALFSRNRRQSVAGRAGWNMH